MEMTIEQRQSLCLHRSTARVLLLLLMVSGLSRAYEWATPLDYPTLDIAREIFAQPVPTAVLAVQGDFTCRMQVWSSSSSSSPISNGNGPRDVTDPLPDDAVVMVQSAVAVTVTDCRLRALIVNCTGLAPGLASSNITLANVTADVILVLTEDSPIDGMASPQRLLVAVTNGSSARLAELITAVRQPLFVTPDDVVDFAPGQVKSGACDFSGTWTECRRMQKMAQNQRLNPRTVILVVSNSSFSDNQGSSVPVIASGGQRSGMFTLRLAIDAQAAVSGLAASSVPNATRVVAALRGITALYDGVRFGLSDDAVVASGAIYCLAQLFAAPNYTASGFSAAAATNCPAPADWDHLPFRNATISPVLQDLHIHMVNGCEFASTSSSIAVLPSLASVREPVLQVWVLDSVSLIMSNSTISNAATTAKLLSLEPLVQYEYEGVLRSAQAPLVARGMQRVRNVSLAASDLHIENARGTLSLMAIVVPLGAPEGVRLVLDTTSVSAVGGTGGAVFVAASLWAPVGVPDASCADFVGAWRNDRPVSSVVSRGVELRLSNTRFNGLPGGSKVASYEAVPLLPRMTNMLPPVSLPEDRSRRVSIYNVTAHFEGNINSFGDFVTFDGLRVVDVMIGIVTSSVYVTSMGTLSIATFGRAVSNATINCHSSSFAWTATRAYAFSVMASGAASDNVEDVIVLVARTNFTFVSGSSISIGNGGAVIYLDAPDVRRSSIVLDNILVNGTTRNQVSIVRITASGSREGETAKDLLLSIVRSRVDISGVMVPSMADINLRRLSGPARVDLRSTYIGYFLYEVAQGVPSPPKVASVTILELLAAGSPLLGQNNSATATSVLVVTVDTTVNFTRTNSVEHRFFTVSASSTSPTAQIRLRVVLLRSALLCGPATEAIAASFIGSKTQAAVAADVTIAGIDSNVSMICIANEYTPPSSCRTFVVSAGITDHVDVLILRSVVTTRTLGERTTTTALSLGSVAGVGQLLIRDSDVTIADGVSVVGAGPSLGNRTSIVLQNTMIRIRSRVSAGSCTCAGCTFGGPAELVIVRSVVNITSPVSDILRMDNAARLTVVVALSTLLSSDALAPATYGVSSFLRLHRPVDAVVVVRDTDFLLTNMGVSAGFGVITGQGRNLSQFFENVQIQLVGERVTAVFTATDVSGDRSQDHLVLRNVAVATQGVGRNATLTVATFSDNHADLTAEFDHVTIGTGSHPAAASLLPIVQKIYQKTTRSPFDRLTIHCVRRIASFPPDPRAAWELLQSDFEPASNFSQCRASSTSSVANITDAALAEVPVRAANRLCDQQHQTGSRWVAQPDVCGFAWRLAVPDAATDRCRVMDSRALLARFGPVVVVNAHAVSDRFSDRTWAALAVLGSDGTSDGAPRDAGAAEEPIGCPLITPTVSASRVHERSRTSSVERRLTSNGATTRSASVDMSLPPATTGAGPVVSTEASSTGTTHATWVGSGTTVPLPPTTSAAAANATTSITAAVPVAVESRSATRSVRPSADDSPSLASAIADDGSLTLMGDARVIAAAFSSLAATASVAAQGMGGPTDSTDLHVIFLANGLSCGRAPADASVFFWSDGLSAHLPASVPDDAIALVNYALIIAGVTVAHLLIVLTASKSCGRFTAHEIPFACARAKLRFPAVPVSVTALVSQPWLASATALCFHTDATWVAVGVTVVAVSGAGLYATLWRALAPPSCSTTDSPPALLPSRSRFVMYDHPAPPANSSSSSGSTLVELMLQPLLLPGGFWVKSWNTVNVAPFFSSLRHPSVAPLQGRTSTDDGHGSHADAPLDEGAVRIRSAVMNAFLPAMSAAVAGFPFYRWADGCEMQAALAAVVAVAVVVAVLWTMPYRWIPANGFALVAAVALVASATRRGVATTSSHSLAFNYVQVVATIILAFAKAGALVVAIVERRWRKRMARQSKMVHMPRQSPVSPATASQTPAAPHAEAAVAAADKASSGNSSSCLITAPLLPPHPGEPSTNASFTTAHRCGVAAPPSPRGEGATHNPLLHVPLSTR